jgi:hypothetical protein
MERGPTGLFLPENRMDSTSGLIRRLEGLLPITLLRNIAWGSSFSKFENEIVVHVIHLA